MPDQGLVVLAEDYITVICAVINVVTLVISTVIAQKLMEEEIKETVTAALEVIENVIMTETVEDPAEAADTMTDQDAAEVVVVDTEDKLVLCSICLKYPGSI